MAAEIFARDSADMRRPNIGLPSPTKRLRKEARCSGLFARPFKAAEILARDSADMRRRGLEGDGEEGVVGVEGSWGGGFGVDGSEEGCRERRKVETRLLRAATVRWTERPILVFVSSEWKGEE